MNTDMENESIRYLGDLQRIQPTQPGDIFVLAVPGMLNIQQRANLRTEWARVMGDARLLIIAGGMNLTIVNADLIDPEQRHAAEY